jgi:hypothetical protein
MSHDEPLFGRLIGTRERLKATNEKSLSPPRSISQMESLKLYTLEEAMAYLRVDRGILHTLIKMGQLPAYDRGGELCFLYVDLEACKRAIYVAEFQPCIL